MCFLIVENTFFLAKVYPKEIRKYSMKAQKQLNKEEYKLIINVFFNYIQNVCLPCHYVFITRNHLICYLRVNLFFCVCVTYTLSSVNKTELEMLIAET